MFYRLRNGIKMHKAPSNKSCKKNILLSCRIPSAKSCWSVSTTTKMQKQDIKIIHVKLFPYQQHVSFEQIKQITDSFRQPYLHNIYKGIFSLFNIFTAYYKKHILMFHYMCAIAYAFYDLFFRKFLFIICCLQH